MNRRITLEESIVLQAPVRKVYDQCTQFEHYPRFFEELTRVQQIDDRHVRWRLDPRVDAGTSEAVELETEICEQLPDKRIAWKTLAGPAHAGVVTFHRLDDGRSKMMIQVDYVPEGLWQQLRERLGTGKRRLRTALERFKQFIEIVPEPTGAWRGSIPAPGEEGRATAQNSGARAAAS